MDEKWTKDLEYAGQSAILVGDTETVFTEKRRTDRAADLSRMCSDLALLSEGSPAGLDGGGNVGVQHRRHSATDRE